MVKIIGLFAAGIAAGLTGSVAGLASLCSYPALLAAGLSPVSANVTNTVALIFSTVGSVSGSRPELLGQAPRLRRLVPVGIAGGLTGAVLLLVTPPGAFKRIVPWLILLASLSLLRRRAVVGPGAEGSGVHAGGGLGGDGTGGLGGRREGWALAAGVFVIAIYGGYFGAAAGVGLLALLLYATAESVPRASAAKNLVLGVANGAAAILFAVASPVRWSAAVPLAAGLLCGGRMGPVVIRRSPPRPLLAAIALAGVGLAAYLGITAYT